MLHGEPSALCQFLAEQGLEIEARVEARKAFAYYLSRIDTEQRITLAPRIGWTDIGGQRIFVLLAETIATKPLSEQVRLAVSVASHSKIEARGTLEDWKREVASLTTGNPLAVLAISMGFASPLLELTRYESGGIHLHGTSGIGKTTCARLMASVFGRGDEHGALRSWRTTANASEASLAGANDVGIVFDEHGQVDPAAMYEMVYMITGGVGKTRMRRDASLREPFAWRVLALSTGEYAVEAKLTEDNSRWRGRKSRAGQTVRMIDLKVDREFIRELIEKGITGDVLRAIVSAFVEAELKDKWAEPSGQAIRVATRLGLIAAAGELAIEFGVVPWKEGEAQNAASIFLQDWLAARGDAKPHEEAQAITQVRHFIEAYGDSRFDPLVVPIDEDGKPVDHATVADIDRRAPIRAGYRRGNATSGFG
jgi:hypothetical protein